MDTPQKRFDESMADYMHRIAGDDPRSDDFAKAVSSLEKLSKIRPPDPEPEPTPAPVPTTRRGKLAAGFAKAWDNETTRVALKAGGSLAGVVAVVWATVHRDHVLERDALNQANQRN